MINLKREINNLNKLMRSNYVFLHLPRSAGSSIKNNINKTEFKNQFTLKHHGYSIFMLNYLDSKKIKFCTVRDPYAWYMSIYNSKMTNPEKNIARGKDYSIMSNNSFEDFFLDVISGARGKDNFSRWFKPLDNYYLEIFDYGAPSVGWYTKNLLWYGSSEINYNNYAQEPIEYFVDNVGIDFFLRVECLQDDFNEMVEGSGISVSLLKRYNTVSHNNQTNTSNSIRSLFSDEMISYISEKDSLIFELFGYEK